jgi:ferredoxin
MARLIPVVLSVLVFAAHFLRRGELWLVVAIVASLVLLTLRQKFVPRVFTAALLGIGLFWVAQAMEIARIRMALGEPWLRMGIILAVVAAGATLSGFVFRSSRLRNWYAKGADHADASAGAFFLVGLALLVVSFKVPRDMLLADRFYPGSGPLEILVLSTYAAFVTGWFLDDRLQARARRLVWLLFSVAFFSQLVLGLTVDSRFLMDQTPHLPVPALIAAGPIYRGEGLFMPILFGVTLLLVGPAWCSHLCYIGAVDNELSRRQKRPQKMPAWTGGVRIGVLLAVMGAALLLRALGASATLAAGLAGAFGILGVLVMVLLSSRMGLMVHCLVYCPMGLLAAALGKLSPFRLKIDEGCNECGACGRACRYDALRPANISQRCPGLSCTLCGDCLAACPSREIRYAVPGLSPSSARGLFAALAASLSAVFLALARL